MTYLDDLARGSSAHSLDGIDEVRFRRGDAFHAHRSGSQLTLVFSDPSMSRDHGRLDLRDRVWTIDDPSSKNGTWVDGEVVRTRPLHGLALLELGRTMIAFEEATSSYDRASEQLPGSPALRTLSPTLARAFNQLVRCAKTDGAILIRGEPGTGKALLAITLYSVSGHPGDLVMIDCAHERTLPQEVFDLRAGTLILENIDALAENMARTILPLIFQRSAVRVICTSENTVAQLDTLASAVHHVVTLPALRERRTDLGLLIATFAARIAPTNRRLRLDRSTFRFLWRHAWPQNIRELECALLDIDDRRTAVAMATRMSPPTMRIVRRARTCG